MNCKQGDLAVIVKSTSGYEGKIIQCTEWVDDYWQWKTDFFFTENEEEYVLCCDDCDLRPIRDSDKEDEMLSIVKIKEPACQ